MNLLEKETIAAVATPAGRGGVGIVRVSGPQSFSICEKIIGYRPPLRRAEYTPFYDRDGTLMDEGIVLLFQGPHSFTGEDVVEFQGHGGPIILDMILNTVVSHGARLAQAGEFSLQAYLNDKIDLVQAEAIADLIDSGSREAAKSALRSLQGDFSRLITELQDSLIELRMYVEASIDFPEEEIDFLQDTALHQKTRDIIEKLQSIQRSANQGSLLREGMTIVLAGLPNAGKSSLLNALAGSDSAIVTDIPGTTRDVLREQIQIDGLPLHIVDTAGIRDSQDGIEMEGVRRAKQAVQTADRILWILDDQETVQKELILRELPTDIPVSFIHNKIDITNKNTYQEIDGDGHHHLYIAAKENLGIGLLREHLKESVKFEGVQEGSIMARRRHVHALENTMVHLERSHSCLQSGQGELMAEELRLAQQGLGQITGEYTSDDLLGDIFSSFCIGK